MFVEVWHEAGMMLYRIDVRRGGERGVGACVDASRTGKKVGLRGEGESAWWPRRREVCEILIM